MKQSFKSQQREVKIIVRSGVLSLEIWGTGRKMNNLASRQSFFSRSGAISVPTVLIHLHIHKTGGTSLNSLVKHGFRPPEIFECLRLTDEVSGLDIDTLRSIAEKLNDFGFDCVRYVSGHVPFGVHRLFDSPAKYFTVVRDPIERIISLFHFRAQGPATSPIGAPFHVGGKQLSFEQYVESRCDTRLDNFQVRVLSGRPELNPAAAATPGDIIFGTPVKRHHLEQAKRNIEEHFLVAAPLENILDCALILKTIYGWPMRRLYNEYKNRTMNRPRAAEIPARLIDVIRQCNRYDLELCEWVRARFAEQRKSFEPHLSREVRCLRITNGLATAAGTVLPSGLRKRMAEALFYP
jgi:hypothetical protein